MMPNYRRMTAAEKRGFMKHYPPPKKKNRKKQPDYSKKVLVCPFYMHDLLVHLDPSINFLTTRVCSAA